MADVQPPQPPRLEDASTPAPESVPAPVKEPVPEKLVKKSARWLRAQLGKSGLTPRKRRSKAAIVGAFASHTFYNNLWSDAMKDIRSLMGEEKNRGSVTGNDRPKMFQVISEVYYQYLKLYKTMDTIYDQMVHPQKRLVVRKLLDPLIAHMIQLRSQLVLCDLSEVNYFDDLAMVEGLLPKEMEIPIPKYYFHDPTPEMTQRDEWFVQIKSVAVQRKLEREEAQKKLKAKQDAEKEDDGGWTFSLNTAPEDDFNPKEIVLPLQTMERARQAKGRYFIAKYMYDEEQQAKKKKHKSNYHHIDANAAATIITKLVRGFLARIKVKVRRNKEMEFLGIRPAAITADSPFAPAKLKCKENADELKAAKERRRYQRRMRKKQYEEAKETIYKTMQIVEGPDMAERFKYQIRNWFVNVKEETGKFPDIPKADVGGSRLVICPESLPDDVREKGREFLDPDYAKKMKKERQKAKEKAKKDKAKAKAKAKAKKGKKGALDNPNLEAPKNMDELKAANLEYNRFWRGLDDKDNPDQKHDEKIIIREKREIVALEVREVVDEAMKKEIEYLRQVIEKKKAKKGKGKKGKGKGKGKKGKGKGKKGGKKGRKKRGKDLTANRTMESLFKELVDYNIIHEYPKVHMEDLLGQGSYINSDLLAYHTAHPFVNKTEERYMPGDANPLPTLGDLIRSIKDVCILPMGSVDVHSMSPITKSVLICGPSGCGKTTMLNMICTELRATLFDLTAANIAGKYPGKPGLKMLMHLIDKVGHAVAPVVVLIDNCEKTYQKKVPKDDKTEPKRLKKQIGKFLKTIKEEDLFLLVGLTSEPWLAPFKALKKDYQRMFYMPPTDYGTRYEMWRKALNETPELLHPDINFSLLTKLSAGWTIGNIRKACTDMVNRHHKEVAKSAKEKKKENDPWAHLGQAVKRIQKIGKLTITMDKIIDCLTEYEPVFLEQEKLWTKFWNKTPLQKARLSTQVKGGGKKGKDKKGKGKKGKK